MERESVECHTLILAPMPTCTHQSAPIQIIDLFFPVGLTIYLRYAKMKEVNYKCLLATLFWKEVKMAYVEPNYKTKKLLKEAIKAGKEVTVFQPGGMFSGNIPSNGKAVIEGPHYPEPHKWYASVTIVDGLVTKVS